MVYLYGIVIHISYDHPTLKKRYMEGGEGIKLKNTPRSKR